MKYTNNFAEVAKVFEAIAKVEEKASKFNAAAKEYEEASIAAYNKDLRSPEVKKMLDTFNEKEKAVKAYRKAAKKVVEVMGLNKENIEEEYPVKYANRAYFAKDFVYAVKWLAMKMVQKVDVYAE